MSGRDLGRLGVRALVRRHARARLDGERKRLAAAGIPTVVIQPGPRRHRRPGSRLHERRGGPRHRGGGVRRHRRAAPRARHPGAGGRPRRPLAPRGRRPGSPAAVAPSGSPASPPSDGVTGTPTVRRATGARVGRVTVDVEQLGVPVDARPLMRTVRARLDDLLADLDEADWRRATVCPGWDVADLVAHIIGDDLGRLSRTHDGAAGPPWRPGEDLPAYLDRINGEWVVAFRRLSPAVLVSLLGAGGGEVLAMWDDAIGDDDPAGAVSWAGLEDGAGLDGPRPRHDRVLDPRAAPARSGRSSPRRPRRGGGRGRRPGPGPPASHWRTWTRPTARTSDVRADDLGLSWRIERRDGRWWFAGHRPSTAEAEPVPFATVTGTGDALLAPVEPPPGRRPRRLRHLGRPRRGRGRGRPRRHHPCPD